MLLRKVIKEIARFRKKILGSNDKNKEKELEVFREKNKPFEELKKGSDFELSLEVPEIKSPSETVDKILEGGCSLARFGDGEFRVMRGRGINFQVATPALVEKLSEVLSSNEPTLLIALPDCFGSLDNYLPEVADFWRKWLGTKRQVIYGYLDMNRTYYSAFFTRAYMLYQKTEAQYLNCQLYFDRLKKIWDGRDVLICEGEGTRFGVLNDLLEGANSVSRVLCPARNAFDKYDDILSAFEGVAKDKLILIALGPTATALTFDLHHKGFQAIDIGHLDIEYEWFLRKDENARPLEHKYVDGSVSGRKVHVLENEEYQNQIIKRVL